MKPASLLILSLLVLLQGCGEDTGRNDRGETFTPPFSEDTFVVPTQAHRTAERAVIESRAFNNLAVAGTLPEGYRIIPLMASDDEGASLTNPRTRRALGRPTIDCGLGETLVISQRISDCAGKNQTRATWNGVLGNAGEATWRLVARSGTLEVWLDTRTRLLWSPVVATTNWCEAAGNNLQEDGPIVNCQELGKVSSCVGKVILGLSNVVWRLPTRNDYLQADIDGLRYVLPTAGSAGSWTATLDSSAGSRNLAWVYVDDQGILKSSLLPESKQVRCVGAAAL